MRSIYFLKKGLSLIEVMIVLFIIISLGIIAIPSYRKHKKQAYQLEAKNNLSIVRQASMSYLLEHSVLNGNLQTIGALPKGNIQYNVGADWTNSPYTHRDGSEDKADTQSFSRDFCPCCDGRSSYPNDCCSEAKVDATLTPAKCAAVTNRCYGNPTSTIESQLTAIDSTLFTSSNVTANDRDGSNGLFPFKFYAIGCVGAISGSTNIDVWSIDERSFLHNEKSGIE